MNKINYDKHDWIDGEPITETLFDNIESGVGRATSSTNLLVDRTNQEEESLSIIEGKIEHQDMEFDIAIGEHDTLDERLKADVSRFVEVWSGGNYMPFEGKNIMVNNSKVGWIRDFNMKGETYQNMITGVINVDEGVTYSNGKIAIYTESNVKIGAVLELKYIKPNTKYTLVYRVINMNANKAECWVGGEDEHNLLLEERLSDENGRKVFTSRDSLTNDITLPIFILGDEGITYNVVIDNLMLFEGDYTDREIPSFHIDGIESVGEKEGNKISILSRNKNLFKYENLIKGTYADRDGSYAPAENTVCTKTHIKINSNKLYYETNSNFVLGDVYTYNENKKYMKVLAINKSEGYITLDDNIKYIMFNIKAQNLVDNFTVNDVPAVIMICESNKKLNFEPYKEEKKEISLPIEGGLKSLPDGTCDTIEQREDGVYLVQRIEKVTYAEGDENLDNCITDKTISYKAKATPVETKLDIDMSKWLTYQDVTYFTTTCNVQPTLSLKAPVDINAVVSELQTANYSLRRNNQQLEQESQQAEKELNTLQEQHDQQTADLLDMDMRVLMLEE